ncbi:hypothetical protein OIU76_007803 [Salix suchowensis]|nr:hypothetical protein OIU76_007803 [Salix suchowensis]
MEGYFGIPRTGFRSEEKRWLIRRQEETSRHLAAYNFVTINIISFATSAIALGPCGVVDNLTLDSPWLIFSFSFVLTSTKALLPLISIVLPSFLVNSRKSYSVNLYRVNLIALLE